MKDTVPEDSSTEANHPAPVHSGAVAPRGPQVDIVYLRADGKMKPVDDAERRRRRATGCEETDERDFLRVTREDGSVQIYPARYIPYDVTTKVRHLKDPMLVGCGTHSKKVRSYTTPVVKSYLDVVTGEILEAKDLANVPECQPVWKGERVLQAEAVLSEMRPEVREFALYLLQFRNRRRGFTPGLETLVNWFAELHGRRASDVRRLIPALVKAKFCEAEGDILFPIFQKAAVGMKRSHYLGEFPFSVVRQSRMLRHRDWRILSYIDEQEDQNAVGAAAILQTEMPKSWKRLANDPNFLAKLRGEGLSRGVVVPLKHLQRLMPGDSGQLDDVGQPLSKPRGGGVPEVVEAKPLNIRPLAQALKHLVECCPTDWEELLAA